MAASFFVKWKRNLKKFGGFLNIKNKNRIRQSITFMTQSYGQKKVISCVKDFLLAEMGNLDLVQKIRQFKIDFIFTQSRMRARVTTKFSKVDILNNFWDKLIGQV